MLRLFFASASKLVCPVHACGAGLKVDKRGSATRAAKVSEVRTNALIAELRAHNVKTGGAPNKTKTLGARGLNRKELHTSTGTARKQAKSC